MVSNGDLVHTYGLMQDSAYARKRMAALRRTRLSPSLFVVHLGIKGRLPDLAHHTILSDSSSLTNDAHPPGTGPSISRYPSPASRQSGLRESEMDRRWQPWTLEDGGCLRSLMAIGLPDDEIATSIGRNEEEVRRRMRILGLGVGSQPARRDHTPVRRTLTLRRAVSS